MEQEIATQVVGLGGASDFSLWQLFLRADWVVKSVIIILLASSIFSWALIFDKVRLFRRIDKSTELFENKFWKSKSAEAFYKSLPIKSEDPLTLIFQSAMSELIKTKSKSSAVQIARVTRVVEVSFDKQSKNVVNQMRDIFKNDKDISEVCEKTIKGYLDYMEATLAQNYSKKYYFGVPAPTRKQELLDELDIKRIEMVKIYNSLLKQEVLSLSLIHI